MDYTSSRGTTGPMVLYNDTDGYVEVHVSDTVVFRIPAGKVPKAVLLDVDYLFEWVMENYSSQIDLAIDARE